VDISERIADQQKRIDSRIASGVLTREEADIVQDNLNWIRAELRRLRSDGSSLSGRSRGSTRCSIATT
jgi:hypothetical protein